MEKLPQEEEKTLNDELKEPTIESPKLIVAIKTQWTKFQNITTQKTSDSLWLVGLKYFFKGVMIFLLILLSPIFLVVITIVILASI